MYTTTSKKQEGFTLKDSHSKCFITTNSTAELSPGAVNRGDVLRACFRHIQRSIRRDGLSLAIWILFDIVQSAFGENNMTVKSP